MQLDHTPIRFKSRRPGSRDLIYEVEKVFVVGERIHTKVFWEGLNGKQFAGVTLAALKDWFRDGRHVRLP